MSKVINLSKSVYDICKEHPDVIEIMKSLGFESIDNPAMLGNSRASGSHLSSRKQKARAADE